jgi:hypothetical protein
MHLVFPTAYTRMLQIIIIIIIIIIIDKFIYFFAPAKGLCVH